MCASPEPLVVACGGGTVLDPENRRALRAAGSSSGCGRPRRCSPRASATARAGRCCATIRPARWPGSSGCANRRTKRPRDAEVDTDGLDVDAVADAVLSVFEEAAA